MLEIFHILKKFQKIRMSINLLLKILMIILILYNLIIYKTNYNHKILKIKLKTQKFSIINGLNILKVKMSWIIDQI